jgi:hypothetical protein
MVSGEKRNAASKRRLKLFKFLLNYDSKKTPLYDLYMDKAPPREEYVSPLDRSSYNYGYLDTFQVLDQSGNYW